jgi:hypothetical protein
MKYRWMKLKIVCLMDAVMDGVLKFQDIYLEDFELTQFLRIIF